MTAIVEALKTKGRRRRRDPRLKLLAKLFSFDQTIKNNSSQTTVVIGVDEVGRGCLAGPVVAAASVLPTVDLEGELALMLAELNDSKQLKPQQRHTLSIVLKEHAIYAIAAASVEEIDQLNIYHASLLAMQRAVTAIIEQISEPSENILVIVDGKAKIPKLTCPQKSIVKGDGLSASIAAASIIAKVHRDQIMVELANEHPNYHWHSNKGYGSRKHRDAILTHGVNPWHRSAFTARVLQSAEQLELDLEYDDISDQSLENLD